MDDSDLVIHPPLEDQWAIFNPPGHPKLAYDFLAVDDKKYPYKRGGLLHHLVSFIRVDDTYTWSRPVFAPGDGRVTAASDNTPDRERINMVFDLISLLLNKPEEKDGFSAFGGNHIILN
jgi:hypothetical protein